MVSRAQLIECGVSTSSIDRWVRHGRLLRLYRGVYAVGHAKLRLEGRFMAAVLACGLDAVLSHRSAAYLLEMRRTNPDRIDVTTPNRAGRKPPPGVNLHRTRDLRDEDVTVHRGIPTTTPSARSPTSPTS